MKINGTVSIGRDSSDTFYIEFKDLGSRTRFARAEMDAEQFAKIVTGLNGVHVPILVEGLDKVGKVKVSERRSKVTNTKSYSKEVLRQWLRDNAQEDGWEIDDYLGSQESIRHDPKTGFTALNYRVFRYEDQK